MRILKHAVIAALLIVTTAVPSLARGGHHHWRQQEKHQYDAPEIAAAPSFALVIGNGSYSGLPPLRNPVNDARLMDQALRSVGYEVIRLENATKAQFDAGLRQLTARLSPAAVSLVYYAGHGVQMGGRNYLIPVDARIETDAAVRAEAIDLDEVLEQIARARGRVNIVILDACRDNPFGNPEIASTIEQTRRGQTRSGDSRFRGIAAGLAPVTAPSGIFIAYATAPGSVAADGDGPNGLYTAELIRAMFNGHKRVEGMFKVVRNAVMAKSGGTQTPWESSSLTTNYSFRPRPTSPDSSSPSLGAAPGTRPSASALTLAQRIAGIASEHGIAVPESFDFHEPAADAPRGSAALLGAWGPGMWGGGRREIIIVEDIDRSGNVQLVEMSSGCCANMHKSDPASRKRWGKLVGGRIVFHHPDRFGQAVDEELELLGDGQLHGTAAHADGSVGKIALPRIQ